MAMGGWKAKRIDELRATQDVLLMEHDSAVLMYAYQRGLPQSVEFLRAELARVNHRLWQVNGMLYKLTETAI